MQSVPSFSRFLKTCYLDELCPTVPLTITDLTTNDKYRKKQSQSSSSFDLPITKYYYDLKRFFPPASQTHGLNFKSAFHIHSHTHKTQATCINHRQELIVIIALKG